MKRLTSSQLAKVIGPAAAQQLGLSAVAPAVSKYNVKRGAPSNTVDGITFASGLEARFYIFLRQMVPADRFMLQPRFLLVPKTEITLPGGEVQKNPHVTFKVDFAVGRSLPEAGVLLTEADPKWATDLLLIDTKGRRMRDYIMRKKMLASTYGLGVLEVSESDTGWLHLIPLLKQISS